MRRRGAIAGAALAAATTVALRPLATLAQQPKIPTIGILVAGRPDPEAQIRMFREGLRELGYVEERNIRVEVRSAEGSLERLPALAAELVRENVDVIVPWQTPASLAAKQATGKIPIVLLSAADPVSTGLVASLARPGGNVTGTAAMIGELGSKNLELLKELLPSARHIAALGLAANLFWNEFLKEIKAVAQQLGVQVVPELAASPDDLERAFAAVVAKRVDAALVLPTLPVETAALLALRHRLPAASPWRPFAEAGGVMAYTFNQRLQFHQAAVFVDRILKGAKPADLPVQQPTKFELVINLKTANALGLIVPQSLLARADEVIE